jgi:adenylosuccinate synthase
MLKICTAYRLGDRTIEYVPSDISLLERCEPVFEDMPGWSTPISDIREYSKLPLAARKYVKRIEEFCDCPAKIISVGPAREQTIFRGKIY